MVVLSTMVIVPSTPTLTPAAATALPPSFVLSSSSGPEEEEEEEEEDDNREWINPKSLSTPWKKAARVVLVSTAGMPLAFLSREMCCIYRCRCRYRENREERGGQMVRMRVISRVRQGERE